MTHDEMRLRCIEIAAERYEWTRGEDLIDEARKYYEFVIGWTTVKEPVTREYPRP
jgi:hypothetical protein